MEQSDRQDEPRVLTEEFVDRIDKLTKSPSERARFVWIELVHTNSKVTNWDLICFCVEALGFMSSEFPWLKKAAVAASQLVYKAHYLNHDKTIASDHEINLVMNIPKMGGR